MKVFTVAPLSKRENTVFDVSPLPGLCALRRRFPAPDGAGYNSFAPAGADLQHAILPATAPSHGRLAAGACGKR